MNDENDGKVKNKVEILKDKESIFYKITPIAKITKSKKSKKKSKKGK